MPNGQVRPYFLWGAYKGYEKDGKLRSISGVLPTVSKTKASFQDLARQGRNTNFGLTAVFERWAIMLMFYTEFGTLDSQEACGRGIVDMTWEEGLQQTPISEKQVNQILWVTVADMLTAETETVNLL